VTAIILAPTPEVRAACDRIDDAISRALESLGRTITAHQTWGTYESSRDAVALFKASVRSVESTIALARTDLVLFPGALMTARGAFEISLRAAWLVDCDDPFDRERRWLAHLHNEENSNGKVAAHLKGAGGDPESFLAMQEQMRTFRAAIEAKFPPGYAVVPKVPNVPEMVRTLHEEPVYILYCYLSQFIHGARRAANYYATDGSPRRDAVTPKDWYLPLAVCWISLFRGARKLLERLDGRPDDFMTIEESTEIEGAIAAVGATA